ncbi:MAG: type II toxin-antitoxin system PemK/MazF family toxin [Chloroflexi bacterium]|nr:type II toxin-antitoxin system PemK/MazF family toxin [Chloroflexota bacterium]
MYILERGDVVWIAFNPQAGHRPAVVLSPKAYNSKVGLALLCPITSQVKGYPFEVLLPEYLPISGAILSDQVKNLDWKVREAKKICHLPDDVMNKVLQRVKALLEP